ncbi:MAG: pilin [Burkholderiales bacterium]|nr:pilin [Burkholderiales bacterium]
MIIAATSPKTLVSEAFQSDGLAGVTAAATEYNGRAAAEKQSKYVENIAIATATGVITVTSKNNASAGLPTAAMNKTLVFSPNVNNAALVAGATGPIDWACGSTTVTTAQKRGLGNRGVGTMPAKYAPSECR